jgi:cell division protein FtsL
MAVALQSNSPNLDPAPKTTPQLRVVPRRKRAAGFAVTLSVLVISLMLGAAVLHTQLAERQLHMDSLERSVRTEQDRFDVLRRQRAELRSPARLAAEARQLGMAPAGAAEFVSVDQLDVARAIAATGRPVVSPQIITPEGPLEQFLLVKAVGNQAP